MKSRLILVEGLPGSGKTTIAKTIDKIINEMGVNTKLYLEGNLDHPADYEGVAYFEKEKYEQLLVENIKYQELISKIVEIKGDDCFISFAKGKSSFGEFPDELFNELVKNDIYELPLDFHIELLTNKWQEFVKAVKDDDSTYIFECCFIQNPITVSMIRSNSSKDIIFRYIKNLAQIVQELDPILIYVTQKDMEYSFSRVIDERPKDWLSFFIDYYTTKEFGKSNNYSGLKGAIEILKIRKIIEEEIVDALDIKKVFFDNSNFSIKSATAKISNILKNYS